MWTSTSDFLRELEAVTGGGMPKPDKLIRQGLGWRLHIGSYWDETLCGKQLFLRRFPYRLGQIKILGGRHDSLCSECAEELIKIKLRDVQ